MGDEIANRARDFAYAPFYCEENVWHLAGHAAVRSERRLVVFVTNAFRHCALFHQRAAPNEGDAVVWDYHVLLFVERDGWTVWDLDSTLPFPTPLSDYLDATFPRLSGRAAALAPRFRLVDADAFRRTFASDRSHMRHADGSWQAPPPSWPAILPEGVAPNLSRYLDLDDPFAGDVLDLDALRRRFAPR